jgi:hypothetical protein
MYQQLNTRTVFTIILAHVRVRKRRGRYMIQIKTDHQRKEQIY